MGAGKVGLEHTLLMATSFGCYGDICALSPTGDKCCAWGWNEHGMCGDGTESNVWTPSPVQALHSARLLLVGCGAGHSLALCQLPAHLVPCQDLKVTYPLQTATENTAMDKEKLEG